MEYMRDIFVLLLISIASYMDVKYKKIFNPLIFIFLVLGTVSYRLDFILHFTIGILLFIIFYILGILGAGDVKLLALIIGYLGYEDGLCIIAIGMIAAAIYGAYYFCSKKILYAKLIYFIDYVRFCIKNHKFQQYYMDKDSVSIMPMAQYFLIGFIFWRIIKIWKIGIL